LTTADRDSGTMVGSAVERWRRFWFFPEPATTLGVIRVAFGLLVVGWTLSLLPDLTTLFGEHGVAPDPQTTGDAWTLLEVTNRDAVVVGLWLLLLASSTALVLGWHSRLASVVVFVSIVSFQRAAPSVFNSGDGLLRIESFFVMLAPSGAALSLDRRRTAGSFWSAQERAPWILRLMQVQLTVIYVFSVLNKLSGDTWREGTAVSYALQMTDIGIFAWPSWITGNALAMNAATWGALLSEAAIGVLVWNRRWRPWVLAVGLVMHAMIMITFAIAFFSLAMYVLYLAFVPAERMQRVVDRVRRRCQPARRRL
jgi:hypothetical protein